MVALAKGVGRVAATDVVVQVAQHHHHEDHAAVRVHDGLGQPRGAAGIDHPQRVVERQPHRLEGRGFCIIPGCSACPVSGTSYRSCSLQIALHDQVRDARQRRAQLLHHVQPINVAPRPGDAVAGDQHLGLDLFEAIQHGVRAHVGRAHAPHRADAGRGQKGDHGLGNVGQVGRHAVARLHALCLQVQRERGDLALQLGPGEFAHFAFFVLADDGRQPRRVGRLHVTQHLVRVVGLRTGKPHRARHHVVRQHRRVRRRRLDLVVVPDAFPERVEVGGGPAPQVVVAVERKAARVAQPVLVTADLGDAGGGAHAAMLPQSGSVGIGHDFASLNDLGLRPSMTALRAMTSVMRPQDASSMAAGRGHALDRARS